MHDGWSMEEHPNECILEENSLYWSKTTEDGFDCDSTQAEDYIVPTDDNGQQLCDDFMRGCANGCGGQGVQYMGEFFGNADITYDFTCAYKVWVSLNTALEFGEAMESLEEAGSAIGNILIGILIVVIGSIVCLVGCCMACCCKQAAPS